MSKLKFMNIEIDNLTMSETLGRIDELIMRHNNAYVVTPNVDHIIQIEKKNGLEQVYKNADLVLTDGKPLIWISKLYGTPIKEKISGSDLFPELCSLAASKGYKMFFLGATEGVASLAAENLIKRFPKLEVVGTYSPPIGFEKDDKEISKIKTMIKMVNPHILIVGLGCPKQEMFIYQYKDELGVPISLGLGASLDFEAGIVKRAPKWMSDNGLEWFYRFLQEPRRMYRRYFVNDFKILNLIIKYWT